MNFDLLIWIPPATNLPAECDIPQKMKAAVMIACKAILQVMKRTNISRSMIMIILCSSRDGRDCVLEARQLTFCLCIAALIASTAHGL